MLIVLWHSAPIHFLNKKVLYNEPQFYKDSAGRKVVQCISAP